MNLNPLVLIDILLSDLVPAKGRRVIHNLILLVAAVVTIWLAAEKDWTEFLIALVSTLYAASNRANTPDESVSGNDEDDLDISVEAEGDPERVAREVFPETGSYGDYQ
jgi:hypothetical protein